MCNMLPRGDEGYLPRRYWCGGTHARNSIVPNAFRKWWRRCLRNLKSWTSRIHTTRNQLVDWTDRMDCMEEQSIQHCRLWHQLQCTCKSTTWLEQYCKRTWMDKVQGQLEGVAWLTTKNNQRKAHHQTQWQWMQVVKILTYLAQNNEQQVASSDHSGIFELSQWPRLSRNKHKQPISQLNNTEYNIIQ